MTMNTIYLLAGFSGVIYAIYIALWPMKPELTWLSVVVGVAMTLAFFAWAEWQQRQSLSAAIDIFVFFVITGGPMIVFQLVKHGWQRHEAERHISYE